MKWLNVLSNLVNVGLVNSAVQDPVVYVLMKSTSYFRFLKMNATSGDQLLEKIADSYVGGGGYANYINFKTDPSNHDLYLFM